MGVDEGFDLFPPLEDTEENKQNWARFLQEVLTKYEGDPNISIDDKGDVVCTLGEHPALTRELHRFRRFSSKLCRGNVSTYLWEVAVVAEKHFGSRIVRWSELDDEHGVYSWTEVYKARGWIK